MSSEPLLQGLSQGKTLFPFAWEKIYNPTPCEFRISENGAPSEVDLTSEMQRVLAPYLYSEISKYFPETDLMLQECQFHLHDHCQITQCISGQIVYLFGPHMVSLAPGDFLLINAMTPHSWVSAQPDTLRYQLGFYPHTLNANRYSQCFLPYFELLYSQHHPYILIDTDHPNYANICHCLNEIASAYQHKQFAYDTIIHNQLFEFSIYLLLSIFNAEQLEKNLAQNDPLIRKALAYIEQHIETKLSIQVLAEHVGLNSSYFSLYFKKHLGISYKKYVTTQKVTKAAHLLQYSDLPITQILFECGFSSVSSFYQSFSSIYAMSPAQFRKLHSIKGQLLSL